MADAVFVLCALTSLSCAALLWRGYKRTRTRLLFWSSLCFWGLFANNLLLIVDLRLFPSVDLLLWRTLPAVVGIGLLLYGLASDVRP
jgi:hypothetical protein